jgi:UDP-N-acetyl-D-mannosaminuronic acid transferase (WecB/TagA/CpsF family)
MPKQERVAVALRATLDEPALIVNGGAVLDFLGERFPRALSWMRSAGLEWLFRLALEPARLYGRYVAGAGPFLSRVVRLRLQSLHAP